MSSHADSKPWTVPALAQAKRDGRKLVMLTAYDAGFARTFDANGVDLILVGDSLGMVVQGHESTLPVTTADMVYHTAAVARVLGVRCWWPTCRSRPMPRRNVRSMPPPSCCRRVRRWSRSKAPGTSST